MNYLKVGDSKKFIVFLHGWAADLTSFVFAKDYFDDYSKLFVDFAGFGKSNEPDRAYYVGDYVDDLKCLLSQFEIEELVIVGHSFGGRVAVKFAHRYQSVYKNFKLCLVCAAGLRQKLSLLRRLQIFRYKKLKAKSQKNPNLKQRLSSFGSSDYKRLSSIMKQTFVNVVNEDLSEEAKNIMCNTAIIWGENDKEVKLKIAKKFNRYIKHSQLFVIKKAGHFCFVDNMQEFLIILDTFVKN